MELENNAIINISNQNENLLPPEQNKQKNINPNQYFVDKRVQSSRENNTFNIRFFYCNLIVCSVSFFLLSVSIFPMFVIPNLDYYLRLAFASTLGIIIPLILLVFCHYKIKLIKDTSNGKLIIKVINYLCFPIMKLKVDIENIHFYIKRDFFQDNETTKETFTLIIINNYKNLVGIDLDTSNIKKKPAKLFYTFRNIWRNNSGYFQFESTLNSFINNSGIYDNPLFFIINNYVVKKNILFHSNGDLSRYMKFSDHLFTYHLNNPMGLSLLDFISIVVAGITNFITISIATQYITPNSDTDRKLKGVYVFLIGNIILYILYKIFKYCFEYIFRIDIIYSRNFDRIFIGLVKYTKTKYIKTFEFQINNISKFIFERVGNKTFNLKVIYKNNTEKQICTIKRKDEYELDGLAYILNERVNNFDVQQLYN